MSERLTRCPITPPPQHAHEALRRVGCEIEERDEGLTLIYPLGATRETIDERMGRYSVFFVHHYEQREVKELYHPAVGSYIIALKPPLFG